jgi:hypothetical protein
MHIGLGQPPLTIRFHNGLLTSVSPVRPFARPTAENAQARLEEHAIKAKS